MVDEVVEPVVCFATKMVDFFKCHIDLLIYRGIVPLFLLHAYSFHFCGGVLIDLTALIFWLLTGLTLCLSMVIFTGSGWGLRSGYC